MKTNYYISPGFFKRGVPFWVLPLVLFILLSLVLTWTLFVTQYNPSNKVFNDIKSSINGENGNIRDRYALALNHFKSGSYFSSAQQFKSIYYQKNISPELKQKSALYYAFSLMLEGLRTGNTRNLQDSRDMFEELIHIIPKNSPYYSRVLLGYARTTRSLGLNYIVGIDAALRQLANMSSSESLRRQIFLELGYYYFAINNYAESSSYFSRASLYIDSNNFFENLLSKEDSGVFILSILKNNLVPSKILSSYGMQMKQKLLKDAMKFAHTGNYISAKNILSMMIQLFPLDSTSEDTYFLMGYIAQKEQNYALAIQYYTKVITNGYLDKDPIALFQMALIYYHSGDSRTSAYYFNIIVQKFPYSYYANEAQKWLEYFYPKSRSVQLPSTPPVSLDENSPDYVFNTSTTSQTRDTQVPYRSTQGAVAETAKITTEKPIVNVNIDQSRSYVSNRQKDSNNRATSTSLERNQGSGNTVVQQRYPSSQHITNMNTTDSNNTTENKIPEPKTFEQEDTPATIEESSEPESPVPSPEIQKEEIKGDDLAEDFESLENNFVDRRPKFKPLF